MRLPNNFENCLFWGSAAEPKPGNNWVILLFDGIRVSTISYRYSQIWGLYVTGTVEDQEIKIIGEINEKSKPTPQKLKQYVDFGNCPPYIVFEDWVQSAVDTAKKNIEQMNPGKRYFIKILSPHPIWAGKTRIERLYKKFGVEPVGLPELSLSSAARETGAKRISDGIGTKNAVVDQNYFLSVIKKENNKPIIIKKNIFRENTPLEFAQNSSKNRSIPITVTPFSKEANHYDLIITKNKGNQDSLVSIYRVRTEKRPIQLCAQFEPGYDKPALIIPGIKDIKILEDEADVPEIFMKRDQKLLQVIALIDATMPENLLEPAKAKLIEVFSSVSRENTRAEFGLVVYGDYSEGHNRKSAYEVKDIPARFLPIEEWIKTCETEVTRIIPADFMSALDKGLSRAGRFPWKDDAEKYLLILFCQPPHPKENPGRDIYKSPFAPAENNWFNLLKYLYEKKNIGSYALYQPKDITGVKAQEIKREISITCQVMKKNGFLEQGVEPMEEIGVSMLKRTLGDYRIYPGAYQIPMAVESDR